jgi:hypothetical protein
MDNYKVLTSSADAPTETSRPNVVGTKKALKKEHGGIDGMVAKYLRFMVNQWNLQYNTPTYHPRNHNQVTRMSPVEEIKLNYDYYLAQQKSNPFAYLTESAEGEELPAPYDNGHEIYQVVNHMVGPVVKHFGATTITIESLDPSVQSKKQTRVAMLQAKKQLPEIFKSFAQEGVQFMPEGGGEGEDMDAAIQEALRKPAHKVEQFGMDILSHVNNTNNIKDSMPKRFKDVVIGRYCGTHITTSAGRIVLEPISPWNLIFDRDDQDDDYNRYSLFKGFVSWKTREEIVQAYTLGADAQDALKELFDSNRSSSFGTLGGILGETRQSGFMWLESDGPRRIACVTGYFIASITDGDGEYYNTIYQGTLIGNTVLVGFGESNNISYDMARPEWPTIPIHIYSPDTVMGVNVCPVDRFRQMQSDCDALMLKIRQEISAANGKNYVFYSDVAQPKDIVEDLKNFRITVINRADPEEPIINNSRMVDVIDMTLDANVIRYIEIRKERKQDMKDVVSQSNITQGMQQTYIGGGTQQATIAQASNGTVSLMQGFFQHFAFIEQHVLNTSKTMLLEAKNEGEADLIFSDSSRDFWKALQDINVMDMQVRIEMEDFIDEETRAELNANAQAWSQNYKDTGFGPVEWLETKEARTTRELKRKLKEIFELKEKKAERMRKEDRADAKEYQNKQLEVALAQQQAKDQSSAQREVIRQTPNMEKVQVEREKLNLEREMSFASEAGLPGTEV